jgi:hypothetical protein
VQAAAPFPRGGLCLLPVLSRREFVAEGAARRALHDRLAAREADVAAAGRGNIEIGFADEESAELWLAESAEEFREPALRYVEFQRFLVMAAHLDRYIVLGHLGHSGMHGRPFAARTALDAVANRREKLLRPIAQGVLDDRVTFSRPSSERSALSTGTRTWA